MKLSFLRNTCQTNGILRLCMQLNGCHAFSSQHLFCMHSSSFTSYTSPLQSIPTNFHASLSSNTAASKNEELLSTSRLGLDPHLNRFHAPIVYHERYSFASWPRNHTFPMHKFQATADALLTRYPGSHMPRSLVHNELDFYRPLDLSQIPYNEWFPEHVICKDYLNRFLSGTLSYEQCRHIGFREQTSKPELIERTMLEVAGTVLTCQLAMMYGIASNVGGGTHHAWREQGAGYTIVNDLAVSANYCLNKNFAHRSLDRVLVIDCDVHQGDGTARYSSANNSEDDKLSLSSPLSGLFTLSIHCEENYPFPKARSTYDISLPSGTNDEEYLQALQESVKMALAEVRPDLVIYDAGIDVYRKDVLGKLNISEEGIRSRDRFVLDTCVTAKIPVAAVIGGGYDKDLDALGRRHAIVHEEAAYLWRKYRLFEKK